MADYSINRYFERLEKRAELLKKDNNKVSENQKEQQRVLRISEQNSLDLNLLKRYLASIEYHFDMMFWANTIGRDRHYHRTGQETPMDLSSLNNADLQRFKEQAKERSLMGRL